MGKCRSCYYKFVTNVLSNLPTFFILSPYIYGGRIVVYELKSTEISQTVKPKWGVKDSITCSINDRHSNM